MKIMLISLIFVLVAGCASVAKDDILFPARSALEQVQSDPISKEYAKFEIYEAEEMLRKAESARSEKSVRHLAYLAERQALIAIAIGRGKAAAAEYDAALDKMANQ